MLLFLCEVVFSLLVFSFLFRNFALAMSLVPPGITDLFPFNHLDLIERALDVVFLVTVSLRNDYVI